MATSWSHSKREYFRISIDFLRLVLVTFSTESAPGRADFTSAQLIGLIGNRCRPNCKWVRSQQCDCWTSAGSLTAKRWLDELSVLAYTLWVHKRAPQHVLSAALMTKQISMKSAFGCTNYAHSHGKLCNADSVSAAHNAISSRDSSLWGFCLVQQSSGASK